MKDSRNILVHRESAGVTLHLSTAGAAPPRPAEWTDRGVMLEPTLVNDPRAWLGIQITRLMGATLKWVKTHL
jgi:hypothetical protein